MPTREELHTLVDSLPEGAMEAAHRLLTTLQVFRPHGRPPFDFNVRNHLTCNLAEAAQPVGNFDESVLVDRRDIPGDVPAIMEDFRRLLRLVEISLHHVRTSHDEKARRAGG